MEKRKKSERLLFEREDEGEYILPISDYKISRRRGGVVSFHMISHVLNYKL